MDVRISFRHGVGTDAFRSRAEEKVRRLTRFEPRLQAVHVLLDSDHGAVAAETRATVPGTAVLVTRAEGASPRIALDRALEKLARRLRRKRDRRVDHQAPPMAAAGE